MTVVNPKSISGITSITTASGSDDLLTIHTNNGTERLRIDSTGATKIVTGIVTTLTATTGIVTTLTTNTTRATTGIVTTLTVTTGIVTSLSANEFGIGTDSPNTELEIQSATDPKIRLQSQESGNKRLELWVDGGESIGYVAADQSASSLAFRTSGTERLRITSVGKVSVNHTATSGMAPLSVKNTDDANINAFEVYNDNGNNSGGFSQASDGDGTVFAKKNDGTLSVLLRSDGDSYVLGDFGVGTSSPQDAGLTVENSSEARLRVRAGSNASNGEVALRADGDNTQIGTWSDHDLKLVRNTTIVASLVANGISFPSGKGIDFSNYTDEASGESSTEEILYDYEAGSFEPSIQGSAGSGMSFSGGSYNGGYYVRVGRIVHVSMNIRGTFTLGSGSGSVIITNLPFTAGNTNELGGTSGNSTYAAFSIPYHTGLTAQSTSFIISGGMVVPNTTNINIYQQQVGAANNPTVAVNTLSTSNDGINIHMSGTYLVT